MKVKNWKKFQHFTDRRPVWIKLYREILDDLTINSLSSDAFKFMIQVWLIASETDGNLPTSSEIAWRLRVSQKKCEQWTLALLNAGLIEEGLNEPLGKDWGTRYITKEVRAAVLARDGGACLHCKSTENIEFDHIRPVSGGGTSEVENIQLLCRSCNRKKRTKTSVEPQATQLRSPRARSREIEKEEETEKKEPPLPPKGDGFEEFWTEYPKKKSRGRAERAWKAIKPDSSLQLKIMAGLHRANKSPEWAKNGGEFIPHPASWLNAKGWTDEHSRIITDPKTGIQKLNPVYRDDPNESAHDPPDRAKIQKELNDLQNKQGRTEEPKQ